MNHGFHPSSQDSYVIVVQISGRQFSQSESVSHSVMSDPTDCVAHQAPLSMGFSRQEYWSGLPFPSSRDLPNSGIEPGSPEWQADPLQSEPPGKVS